MEVEPHICLSICRLYLLHSLNSLNAYSLNGIKQGMVDGSASKPALRQDTGYMVEKTYHDIAPYLGAFGPI